VPKATQREKLHSSILRTFRDERIRKGLSMNVLSQRAGLNQSAISLIERGLRSPNLETLIRLSEALGVDLWQIIKDASSDAE